METKLMTNFLRQLADKKAREIFLVGMKGAPFYTRFNYLKFAEEAMSLVRPSNEPELIHVTESSHSEELARALRVCIQVIEMQNEALKFYGKETNWKDRSPYVETTCIFAPMEDSTGWGPRGNKARETLTIAKSKLESFEGGE
jgi:hypothetical protein